jgi:hypothetical protein
MIARIARGLFVLALIIFALSWVVGFALESRAVLAQRVDPHSPEVALVLGEAGTPIGSPQRLVLFDDRVFLEGTSIDGARLVNEKFLNENNIYPLQWKTVEFVRNAVAIASLIGALLMGLIMWRFSKPRETPGMARVS